MKKTIIVSLLVTLLVSCFNNEGENQSVVISEQKKSEVNVTFDYSAIETLLTYLSEKEKAVSEKLTSHPAYQLIFEHSKKFSSNPINENDLIAAVNGKKNVFDFSEVLSRKESIVSIIQHLKSNEEQIINEYANLFLDYLPKNHRQDVTIYYVIGGYNGIAINDKVAVNIDYPQFRSNKEEIKLYIAHEVFHLGFEKYHSLPNIFQAKTVKDLREIVLAMTMNEGLATLTPYKKRHETNQLNDNDYQVLADSLKLNEKLVQFDSLMHYMNQNLEKDITNDILGNVLGQCSGDRLFYIVGCHMGLTIEEEYDKSKIAELVKKGPKHFFNSYEKITTKANLIEK